MSVIRLFGCSVLLSALLWSAGASGQTPLGTEFTYQGRLKAAGVPADGDFDFIFRLYDGDGGGGGGSQIGGDVVVDDRAVTDGLFTVQLDFGGGIFTGDKRWLEVSVRPGESTGPYTVLSPRQPLTAAPYALYALDGPGGGGFWAANGDNIFNTNNGDVGIGTVPSLRLHIRRLLGTPSGPPTTLGLEWTSIPGGESWCYLAVNANEFTEGTDFFRETNTPLRFLTKDEIGSSSSTTQMVLAGNGNLGIGTISPAAKLDVVASSGQNAISASSPLVGVYGLHDRESGTFPGVWGESNSRSASATAVRGIITSTSPGASSTGVLGLNKGAGSAGIGVWGRHDGLGYGVYGSSNGVGVKGESTNAAGVIGESSTGSGVWGQSVSRYGVYGTSTNSAGVYGWSQNGYAGFFDGTVSVKVLEITGADLAEKFPVSEEVKPGMVVAIDPDHPGKLCLARGVYNRRVAGVVSGANGLPTGAILGHLDGNEDAPPIALSGRVWVYCDATHQSIEPGDLLTTADAPGHAMKVTDHTRAQGAIIGKAMTALHGERGLVLVLVALQ